MLKKIKLINGVGRFYNLSVPGDAAFEFEKTTLFHAMNGYGKSTIVAILKSLSENDPAHIRRKKTIGKNTEPKIVIVRTGETLTFENGSWSSGNKPSIEVFDSHFVHDNLFVQEVTIDHKKNIHRIIIGDEGRKLAEELGKANQAEKTAKKDFDVKDKELKEKFAQTGRNDYLEIKDEERITVETKIAELNAQIKARESEDRIDKIGLIPIIPEFNVPNFDSIKSVLLTSHQSIHEDAKSLVEKHFNQCFSDSSKAKSFIQAGLSIKKDDDCPFCGQNLSNAQALLDAYASYFDETYKNALKGVREEYEKWKTWRFDSLLDECLQAKSQSQLTLEKWKEFLGDSLVAISDDEFLPVTSNRQKSSGHHCIDQ